MKTEEKIQHLNEEIEMSRIILDHKRMLPESQEMTQSIEELEIHISSMIAHKNLILENEK